LGRKKVVASSNTAGSTNSLDQASKSVGSDHLSDEQSSVGGDINYTKSGIQEHKQILIV